VRRLWWVALLLAPAACGSTGGPASGENDGRDASIVGDASVVGDTSVPGDASVLGDASVFGGDASVVGDTSIVGDATGVRPPSDAGGAAEGSVAVDAGLPVSVPVPVTDRTKVQLATGWKFMGSNTLVGAEAVAFDDSTWPSVSVPHTWDSVTFPANRIASFSRSWYRIHFSVAQADLPKRLFVYFEGAFQVADAYVNGHHLGQHRGGYTRFIFDATSAVSAGDNVLAVEVSNADCADCLPDTNTRLFKGYGGIYRKAWLLTTSPYHVATTDFASSGIYVTPSITSTSSAVIATKVLVTNDGTAAKTFSVQALVDDATGQPALTLNGSVMVAAGATVTVPLSGTLNAPHLWSPKDPYLYSVIANVTVDGLLTDSVGEHVGLRSYALTTTDFTLNGVSTRLRGVAKHQETEYSATAVSDAELLADWNNLRDLGVNYVRLVHYPHAQLEYDLADQYGIMVWAEDGQTNSGPPTPNGDTLCRELVYQNWNHPSIIFWSAGNEAPGVAASSEYASVIKAADPSRPVTYASNGQTPTGVDDIFANTYAGWYGGTMYDWLTAGDHWVSETGAGMMTTTHTADSFGMTFTVNTYEPEEYGSLVNEVRFDDLFRNPSHVPAFSGWVFRDISDVKYKNLLNTKGLLTYAGYKKDVFYHFQSFLKQSPVVHLVGRQYFLRSADGAGQGSIKAYSNAAALTLTVNGKVVSTVSNGQYTHPNGTPIKNAFRWPNALVLGKNVVSVADGLGNTDSMTVYYRGAGTTVPSDPNARVTNLTSSNGQAYFVDVPISDQMPFYSDFDGTGDNSFDVVPALAAGASFISTRRQSDATKRTDLAFDLPTGATVYVMFTKQAAVPAWITAAGLTDTGATGRWRDNSPALVNYALYSRTFAAVAHVTLPTTAIDYVVLVK
jgi:beta-galactosidase